MVTKRVGVSGTHLATIIQSDTTRVDRSNTPWETADGFSVHRGN